MKAAVNTRYGPPDLVRVTEVDRPVPGQGEVLVRVHATTVNRTDCGFRAARPWIVRLFSGLTKPKRTVNGSEFAGVVEAPGRGVRSPAVGDRVFGFSEDRLGAHAEYDPGGGSDRDHPGGSGAGSGRRSRDPSDAVGA